MLDIKQCLPLIDNVEIVSFDIFDTILLRPFAIPSDLFDYIETKYKIKGFSSARKKVVVRDVKEKSIEDIYDNLPNIYVETLEKELFEEKRLIYPNTLVKRAYLYALEKNKTIIFTSDIYFHEAFLRELLIKNGFEEFERIYSSCDYQKTKCSGELFGQILSDYNIRPNKILHIGDNEISDSVVPKSMGILTAHILNNCDQYFSYRNYLKSSKFSYWDSYIVKQCADKFVQKNDFEDPVSLCWYRFGYEVAGPICWCFSKWIYDMTATKDNNISDVLFVARDGYLLKKMFDKLNVMGKICSHYVYAPRILATLVQETYKSDEDIQKLTETEISSINKVYELDKYSAEERNNYITELIDKYRQYLKNLNLCEKTIAIVDSTTNNLSSQKIIEKFSRHKTKGLYWFASQYAFSLGYDILTCQKERYVVVESVDLFELIFKSPESTIKRFCMDGSFEFYEPNEAEKSRISNFAFIEKGALEFFDDAESHGLEGYPSATEINRYLTRYCENPNNKERSIIESGKSSGGIANSIWEPTKVFIDRKNKSTRTSIKKKIKRAITKHPKAFIFLRKIYHKFR